MFKVNSHPEERRALVITNNSWPDHTQKAFAAVQAIAPQLVVDCSPVMYKTADPTVEGDGVVESFEYARKYVPDAYQVPYPVFVHLTMYATEQERQFADQLVAYLNETYPKTVDARLVYEV